VCGRGQACGRKDAEYALLVGEREIQAGCGEAVRRAWSDTTTAVMPDLCDLAKAKLVIRIKNFDNLVLEYMDGVRVAFFALWGPNYTVEPSVYLNFLGVSVDTFKPWVESLHPVDLRAAKNPPKFAIIDYQLVCCFNQLPKHAYSQSCAQCFPKYNELWSQNPAAADLLVAYVPSLPNASF
jgi:hypothetical protein